MRLIYFSLILLFSAVCIFPQYSVRKNINDHINQAYSIRENTDDHITIEYNFSNEYKQIDTVIAGKIYRKIIGEGDHLRVKGEPWLPVFNISVGIPFDAEPVLNVIQVKQEANSNILIPPMPGEDPDIVPFDVDNINKEIYSNNNLFPSAKAELADDYVMRYARIVPVIISPYQYNPVKRELIFNKTLTIRIDYNRNYINYTPVNDNFTIDYLESSVINPEQAVTFAGQVLSNNPVDTTYWYNPDKIWYKLFLNNKGVYRITYEYLVNAGANIGSGINSSRLELFNEGSRIPIDVVDNGDSIFNAGDYFQFVGYPPSPSEYSKQNIYNLTNVYWLSFEAEENALRYENKSGYPSSWDRTYTHNLTTLHVEKDSLFERFGHATNGYRDYWQWGKAYKQGPTMLQGFLDRFNGLEELDIEYNPYVTLRVNMHGLTTSIYCSMDHKADIEITGQPVGSIEWDGQYAVTFEKSLYISGDSIQMYPFGNTITVWVKGNTCGGESDEIRVNWYEFEYWRYNRMGNQFFTFKNSDPYVGVNRYWMFNWPHDSLKIYIPNKNIMIKDAAVTHDANNSVHFIDTVAEQNEYFCVSYTHFIQPDSIVKDIPSSLRSLSNGADYLIIAHRDFKKIAEDLVTLRSTSFPDTAISNPRIKLVYIDEIYEEFSYGLLNPQAIKDFIKYTFEKWVSPAPVYVVLLGDMSFDYRGISPSSRKNYIPSMGYHSIEYGLAASDNMFVSVSGNDVMPDMAIGRLSIETIQEGEILLDKLRNYPSDPGKEWKQNVLLLASGLNEQDENKFGFNNESMLLNDRYLEPNGITSRKVFRYPNKPEYIPFRGEGPQIRKGFDEGAVLVNYYGHGGGYQWDLVFTNDDILELENNGRLPVVLSVTCYTAHFDNQDVFGEQFIKIPGKGAVGFWGSSGVTLWGIGNYINQLFFKEVFTNREYLVGRAILKAKRQVSSQGYYASQIALLTYLGDPVMRIALPYFPDFAVKSSDISIIPAQPLAEDTITVVGVIRNLGIYNFGDSVNVELSAVSTDTSYTIETKRIATFGEFDTLYFRWIPDKGGLYHLGIAVNESSPLPEPDHSDNTASASFAVFDLSEPNLVKPINGFTTNTNKMEFVISDIGHFLDLNLVYVIEIDSSPHFNSPGRIIYGNLVPQDGLLRWTSPELNYSPVFWRSRIVNNVDSSRWSAARFFTINQSQTGYYVDAKGLSFLPKYNLIYAEDKSALVLNTSKLPPRPDTSKYIEEFDIPSEIADSIQSTVLTTDGKYFYIGNIWYYSIGVNNPEGKSYIFKIGTGNEGTVKGQYYGTVPNFFDKILNQFFWYPDGNIYVATGNPYYLKRINLTTEIVDSIFIEEGLLDWESAKPKQGAFYLYSDGNLVYNITLYDSSGSQKYVLRTFNPNNNWTTTRPDFSPSGSSFGNSFCSFFVYDNYLYTYENYNSGVMRKYRLEDGFFEEEWITYTPFKGFYSWVGSKEQNKLFATVFYGNYTQKIFSFIANYVDAKGSLTIQEIGPAFNWDSLGYSIIDNSPGGGYQCMLSAYNKQTGNWDTLNTNVPEVFDLNYFDAQTYPYMRVHFNLVDSSFAVTEPIQLKNLYVNFKSLPEVQISNKYLSFNPDSLLQGSPIKMKMNVTNLGYEKALHVNVDFYLDDEDSVFFTKEVGIDIDSTQTIEYEFDTTPLAPATVHKMKVAARMEYPEFFTFNNVAGNGFMVSRDSINPLFKLTIDGKEIFNGDIVSAKPEILISLKDNGPLPLRKEDFTIVYNNVPLKLDTSTIEYDYTPYPNSESTIKWNPVLKNGKHTLEVLAKDPSGNFFDTTSAKVVFYVYNEFDIKYVYNYPNPFGNDTHFTFELRGDDKSMESFRIKVYTIAGRLIREILVDPSTLKAGFNKIYWDGRDQDGEEIANGVYFYKFITTNNGITKTATQKLAKIR